MTHIAAPAFDNPAPGGWVDPFERLHSRHDASAWPSADASLGEEPGPAMSQCHREGSCEFGLSTLGTQPGKQTLLPIACTSGGDHQGDRLPAMERWPTSRKSSKSTVQMLPPCLHGPRPPHYPTAPTRCTRWLTVTAPPGLSGWPVPTQRHRAVMRGSCPPSSVAITSLDGLGPGSALPCSAGRSVPGRGGPERRRRPRPDGTGTPLGPCWVRSRLANHGQRWTSAVTERSSKRQAAIPIAL